MKRYDMQYRPDWAYNQASMMPAKEGRYVEFSDASSLYEALRVLTNACYDEFGCDDRDEDGEYVFDGEDTVSDPDCAITFGMLRKARAALSAVEGGA